jgi:hypothetical protein
VLDVKNEAADLESKSVTQTIVGAHYLRRGLLIRWEVPGGSPEQKQADS